jgi:putative transposase
MDQAFAELVDAGVDVRRACKLLGRPRSTHYWRRQPKPAVPAQSEPRPQPANALGENERARVRQLLRDPALVDKAPAQVWAHLLDQGIYLCSESTMYRILRETGESRQRRRQATHPPKVKPELMAHQPGEVYTWDITKLRGPQRGIWYDLYVMLDIFSRYAVGWTLAETETAELATEFIDDVIRTHGKPKVVHADRGTSMTSKSVAQLLVDLDVVRSHSRPHVSNDNPYSEAQFKTLKYCPAFPDHFDDIDGARAFCKEFFDLLQPRALPLRARTAHPRVRPLRHRREDPRRPRAGPRRRLRPQPRTVQLAPRTTQTAHRGLDQPTQRPHPTTEQLTTRCPKTLDRFRSSGPEEPWAAHQTSPHPADRRATQDHPK